MRIAILDATSQIAKDHVQSFAAVFAPVRILRVGVQDRFSHHCGSYEYLLKEHGLERQAITQRMANFLKANQPLAPAR